MTLSPAPASRTRPTSPSAITSSSGLIDTVAVVIPARDESALVAGCLDSVNASVKEARARHPGVEFAVFLVADSCTDDTALIGERRGASIVEVAVSNVGAARATGVAAALSFHAGSPARQWICCTDADSVVPVDWIVRHLEVARTAELFVGTVRPTFAELSRRQIEVWTRTHAGGAAVGAVHGANLGIRADAYLALGGFAPIPLHEDNDLVARARAAGRAIVAHAHAEVVTSGRQNSRVDNGYAAYLRTALDE